MLITRPPFAPPLSALGSSGVRVPPPQADSTGLPHRTGAERVSLHSAPALMPMPFAESARRWRFAGIRSPRWLPPYLMVPAIALAAPTPSDPHAGHRTLRNTRDRDRSEEHTSELQSRENLVCRL